MAQLRERILSFSCQMGRLLSRRWRGGCRRCLQLVCRTAATVAEQDSYRLGIPGEDQRKGPPPEQVERIRKTEIRCTNLYGGLNDAAQKVVLLQPAPV